ncbi:MAG: HAD hydrolase-like protein [Firmicutes bacterium]|nr:HAD hydrolase-like protein [Bacillota bacterium]
MIIAKKRICLVASDLDGTLVDSVSIYGKTHNMLLGKYGKELPCSTSEFWTRYFYANPEASFDDYIQYIIDTLEIPLSADEYAAEVGKAKAEMLGQVKYKSDADRLARYFKDSGIPVGIVTSSPYEDVKRMANSPYVKNSEMPFSEYDFIVASGNAPRKKPESDPYRMACLSQGVHPSQTFVMEDLLDGVKSARGAGIPKENIVGIYDENAEYEMREIKDAVGMWFNNHAELLEVLR